MRRWKNENWKKNKKPNRIAAIARVVFLPTLVYLGTIAAAAHVAPNYCNSAGGCPWRN